MMERSNISAVLLDMDGTLLDTERVYFESLIAALSSRGYTDDVASLCHAMVGLPGPECEALLIAQYGEDFPLAAISRAFIANRDEILRNRTAVEGWRRRAARCAAGRRMPDGDRDLVVAAKRRSALSLAGIRSRFETILTRDDVTRCKPSPDLYLLAAARLGVQPPGLRCGRGFQPGVTAAHAAGAITIMVPDMVPPTENNAQDAPPSCLIRLPCLKCCDLRYNFHRRFG